VGRPHLARDLQWAGVGGIALAGGWTAHITPRIATSGPEDVVDEEDADQVVEVVVDDGKATVARRPHRTADVFGVHRDRQVGHVDPGRHHLPHIHVPQVGQRFEDDALLLGGGRRRFGGAGFAVALVPGMAAEQA